MAFMTITARKESACKRCGGEIEPGETIRWSRYGGSYHLAKNCPASEYYEGTPDAAEVAAEAEQDGAEVAPAMAGRAVPARRSRGSRKPGAYWFGPDIDRMAEQQMERDLGIR